MSWTHQIKTLVGGKAHHLYHFLSSIAAALACFILLQGLPFAILLAAVGGFLIMLIWELFQWNWDSGFSPEDIKSNLRGALVALPLLYALVLLKQLLPFLTS
jgi:hypothetical protein